MRNNKSIILCIFGSFVQPRRQQQVYLKENDAEFWRAFWYEIIEGEIFGEFFIMTGNKWDIIAVGFEGIL